jgi:hypothetical protein
MGKLEYTTADECFEHKGHGLDYSCRHCKLIHYCAGKFFRENPTILNVEQCITGCYFL